MDTIISFTPEELQYHNDRIKKETISKCMQVLKNLKFEEFADWNCEVKATLIEYEDIPNLFNDI